MADQYKVVSTVKCGEIGEMLDQLYKMKEEDPRGESVGEVVAVHIENKFVQLELREFEDGTREVALSGI